MGGDVVDVVDVVVVDVVTKFWVLDLSHFSTVFNQNLYGITTPKVVWRNQISETFDSTDGRQRAKRKKTAKWL